MTMKVDLQGLEELDKQLAQMESDAGPFFQKMVKELAARLLAKVKKRTPVGTPPQDISEEVFETYWSGYVGGTLRRGWTAKTEAEAMNGHGDGMDIPTYLQGVKVTKEGSDFNIVLINPVHYADYVEFGHRQKPGRFVPALGERLKASFVEGQYMLTISEKELQGQIPSILQQRLKTFLQGAFT